MPDSNATGPLAGFRVVERATGVAAAYAARLLGTLGASVVMVEPEGGTPLRRSPPFFTAAPDVSALFSYLAAAKDSVVCDTSTAEGRADLGYLLDDAHVLIDDTPVAKRAALGLEPEAVKQAYPSLCFVSVLPFGAVGPKAHCLAHEINLIHASGEGYLLPNGLSIDMFPDRPPLKIYGHFAEIQGGVAAALGALAALWSPKPGQFVDISVQDANVAVGAFAIQRFGDGAIEHRKERSFRYGGVLECRDGYVELLMLEERQWQSLVQLMGQPEWAVDEALQDPMERSRRGGEINENIRAWSKTLGVSDIVARGQALGVPIARYNSPAEVLSGTHARARKSFQTVDIPDLGSLEMFTAPFRFGAQPLQVKAPARLGDQQHMVRSARAKQQIGRRAEA